jgi:hypothetical protein
MAVLPSATRQLHQRLENNSALQADINKNKSATKRARQETYLDPLMGHFGGLD